MKKKFPKGAKEPMKQANFAGWFFHQRTSCCFFCSRKHIYTMLHFCQEDNYVIVAGQITTQAFGRKTAPIKEEASL